MDYTAEGVSVYAEAKGEYTRQLCQYLVPALQKYFLDLLTNAKERETDPKRHLIAFQTLLEGISEWNMDKVQRETQALIQSSQCDYLEELLMAVFIAHTKVLAAIRLTNRKRKLTITTPKLDHFLYRTMTGCARLLWTNTFLFSASGTSIERQKNMKQIEVLITEGVLQGVRGMLPVKSILREYLATDDSDEDEDDAEGAEEADAEAEAEAEAEVPLGSKSADPVATDSQPVAKSPDTGPTGDAGVIDSVGAAGVAQDVEVTGASSAEGPTGAAGDVGVTGSAGAAKASETFLTEGPTGSAGAAGDVGVTSSAEEIPMINLDSISSENVLLGPEASLLGFEEGLVNTEDIPILDDAAQPTAEMQEEEGDLGIEFEELS